MKSISIWSICWLLLQIGVMAWVMFIVLDIRFAQGIALIVSCVLGNRFIQPRWEKYNRAVKLNCRLTKKKRFFRQAIAI